jgi:hypothetical protein
MGYWLESQKERDHLVEEDAGGRIMLERMLGRIDVYGLAWLRI